MCSEIKILKKSLNKQTNKNNNWVGYSVVISLLEVEKKKKTMNKAVPILTVLNNGLFPLGMCSLRS